MPVKSNPYLDEFNVLGVTDDYDFERSLQLFQERDRLVQKYAWAVPNEEAIEILLKYSPIVEIGCGTGYWASLIEQSGGEVAAYDKYVNKRGYVRSQTTHKYAKPFTRVVKGDCAAAELHSESTLFLCWPPYDSSMAHQCLSAYLNHGGKTLIYVGEGSGGCTGCDKFHELLDERMESIDCVSIPRWQGMHDYMEIFTVKAFPQS